MPQVTCYLKIKATRNGYGNISSTRAMSVTGSKPSVLDAEELVVKLVLDLPESAWDPVSLNIKVKDTSPVPKQIVADLQKIVADLEIK